MFYIFWLPITIPKTMADQTFHIVAAFDYLSDAEMLKAKLESEEIPVELKDSYILQTNPFISSALGWVKVLVPTNFAEQATAIYNEVRSYAQDNEGKPIICTNCKSNKSVHYLRRDSFLYKLFPFFAPKAYQCTQCEMITPKR